MELMEQQGQGLETASVDRWLDLDVHGDLRGR